MKNQTLHLPHLFRDNLHSQILNEGSGDQKVRSLLQVSQSFGGPWWGPCPHHGRGNLLRLFQKFRVYSELSFELS